MLVRLVSILMACWMAVTGTGCASQEYTRYLEMQERIGLANAEAQKAKYEAFKAIGQGDTTSRVAALMAMGGVGGNGNNQGTPFVAPPKTGWDHFKEVASIFVPVALQAYSIGKSAEIAKNASNNASQTAISTNQTFAAMAGRIQAPAANISTITTTNTSSTDSHDVTSPTTSTSTILSGKGVIGSGTSTDSVVTDRHDVTAPTTTTYTDAYNQKPTTSTVTYPPVP